jgi:primosomal protein N' (replication factor Y)
MYYYHVLARLGSYHGSGFLTYSSKQKLQPGHVVAVSVRKEAALGIVMEQTAKPTFITKPVDRLVTSKPLPVATITLLGWLMDYYPAPLGTIAQQFLPGSLGTGSRKQEAGSRQESAPSSNRHQAIPSAPPLTQEQTGVLESMRQYVGSTVVLHGDTGTGKTRIYIELARQAFLSGRSALILTPEIGLTPQLFQDLQSHFGLGSVILLHSTLTPRERREAWLSILSASKPVIVMGPRSALFSPLDNIGLIVVDEFHETAYKQEQAPYYQAVRVASQLARIHKARLVLGSATPPVQEYYMAEAKRVPILRMQTMAAQATAAERTVQIVDMRDKANLKHGPHLSGTLLDAIKDTLDRKEQALIFLNRRGTARLVLCQDCGWQAACPHCAVPLTYHADSHHLQCHTCGFRQSALASCPECGSTEIIYKSAGTKSIVEALQREFREARVQRFDTDSKKSERIEQHYDALVSGDIDILVGTQMLSKGLDLPRLGLVGVVAADNSLYFPDYTAEERTFQLLSQVIGRVGRGHRAGMAVIQTYTPENPTLQAVVKRDWDAFYRQQTEQRQTFLYPPFCHLLKLNCARATQKSAKQAAEKLLAELRKQTLRVEIIGPSPSFYEKVAGKYRWQLVIKAKDRSQLLKIIPLLPSGWTYDLDPSNLL